MTNNDGTVILYADNKPIYIARCGPYADVTICPPDEQRPVRCVSCGAPAEPGRDRCPYCGTPY